MRALFLSISTTLLLAGCQCEGPNSGTGGGTGGNGGGNSATGGGATATGGGTSATGGGGTGGSAGTGGGASGCLTGATALSIALASPSVAAGGTVTFTVSATVNGQSVDVTGSVPVVASRNDDSPAGTVATSGIFTSAPGLGGLVHLTASDGCLQAATDITVTFSASIPVGDGGVKDSDFGGTVTTAPEGSLPKLIYPHDGTRFPRNIYKVAFQWQRAGHQKFRLTFAGPGSTVQVLTDGKNALCPVWGTTGCWEADAATWLAIAGSNAGAEVQVTVDGIDAPAGPVFRGPSITLGFSRRDVRGAIFYWSTTSAGIRRATVSDDAPEAYLVAKPVASRFPSGARVECVACHTVSRSGRKLFAGTKTSDGDGLFVYEVTTTPPPIPLITTQISTAARGFGTFSPDDTRVVATVADQLAEFDAVTGQRVVNLPVAEGTNPDWSPLGQELAYSNKGGDSPGAAALAVISRELDGGWGNSRTLVPALGSGPTQQTCLFPSYAPDGKHVAYVRGSGGHGDETFQLWLVGADGGNNTELLAANRKVNNCLGVACDSFAMTNGRYENNMPTWAPPGDLDWVAFNSHRPYGDKLGSMVTTQQIWIAAIDRSKVGQRLPDGGLVDPSYPAFRFPFQGLGENNHRAFWTLDVRVEQDAGVAPCIDAGQNCTASSTCCGNFQCQPVSELSFTCQAPGSFDAGVCLDTGQACTPSGGLPCCDPQMGCGLTTDGGTACALIIN